MNIKKIILHNFMSHKDTTLDLSNDGIYSLVGENGAGKSVIRDAITWCLFGKSRAEGAGDDLIWDRGNEKEMYVVVELEHNGKNLQITRKRSRGKSTILQVEE